MPRSISYFRPSADEYMVISFDHAANWDVWQGRTSGPPAIVTKRLRLFGDFRALARISWKLRPQALRAIHQSPPRCRVAYATETLRLPFGLKVVAIGFQVDLDWTTCWCADLRRPQAQRFTLRVSARRRDTKITRNFTKKQHCSSPRHMRPTSSSLSLLATIAHVCPLFHMDELVRKTFAASRHAVFSCHFVRFSCLAGLPRTAG